MPQEMGSALRTKLAAVLADVAMQKLLDVGDFSFMASKLCEVEVGAYTGTGANITVTTTGNPIAVFIMDVTQQCLGVNIRGMAAASFFQVDNGGVAIVGANGVTLGTSQFIIGTAAAINTAADTGVWLALIDS